MEFEKFLDEISEEEKRQTAKLSDFEKWLKCVCAFANEEGGLLILSASEESAEENGNTEGAEALAGRKIKECIEPFPGVSLRTVERENGESILLVQVPAGRETPYYYTGEGAAKAYLRGEEGGLPANREEIRRLVFRGAGDSYDSLSSGYDFGKLSFTGLAGCYQEWSGSRMNEKKYDAFGLTRDGKVTNAGVLFSDDCPAAYSRLFCTRWRGMDKTGGKTGILNHQEYTGNLISLLNNGFSFVKRNTKGQYYCDQSIFEAIVNALAHRDYLIRESEVHIDIFEDRLMICSPGGMADGTKIQERKPGMLSSIRRNPVIADIFQKIGYMERKGSGLNRIRKMCKNAANYSAGKAPEFYSDGGQFTVILKNMNYEGVKEEQLILTEKEKRVLAIVAEFPTISTDHISEKSEIAKRTVERVLQSLKKKGVVIREGSRRSGWWRVVAEDVQENRV